MSMYDLTKDLHHACEAHELGTSMVNGSITPQEWADWLWAMRLLHLVIDPNLPDHMDRHGCFTADLAVLPIARVSPCALKFAAYLSEQDTTYGAAYVLHGAHRSGGRILAPKMAKGGLPTNHTSYRYPEAVRDWIASIRTRSDLVQQARDTFECLLGVMDEIKARAN